MSRTDPLERGERKLRYSSKALCSLGPTNPPDVAALRSRVIVEYDGATRARTRISSLRPRTISDGELNVIQNAGHTNRTHPPHQGTSSSTSCICPSGRTRLTVRPLLYQRHVGPRRASSFTHATRRPHAGTDLIHERDAEAESRRRRSLSDPPPAYAGPGDRSDPIEASGSQMGRP